MVNPRASFLGHLAGILAGLLHVKVLAPALARTVGTGWQGPFILRVPARNWPPCLISGLSTVRCASGVMGEAVGRVGTNGAGVVWGRSGGMDDVTHEAWLLDQGRACTLM